MASSKILSFTQFSHSVVEESVKTDAREIKKEINIKDLEEVDPNKIAAAISDLLDANGDLEKIDIEKLEESYKKTNITEDLNESAGESIIHALEVVSTILGNAALMEFISGKISKILGKKVETSSIISAVRKMINLIKEAVGFPSKVIEKFFEWLGKMFGFSASGQKIMGLLSLGVVVIILFVVGIAFFPAAASITGISGVLALILSVTALIGKAAEIVRIIQDIVSVIKLELRDGNREATKEEIEAALHHLESVPELAFER